MKKLLTLCVAAATAAAFCGCSSLQVATVDDFNGQKMTPSGSATAHISATNCGLYLLWIPLITGSAQNIGAPALLEDGAVSAPMMAQAVTREAQKYGKKVYDLNTFNGSAGFIFYWKTAYASANVAK